MPERPPTQPPDEPSVERFKFRKGMGVGSIEAETDQQFLQGAFVDNGYLDIVADASARQSIIVGRTGAGKSALLLRLEEEHDRVVRMNPEGMSLRYLSDSVVRSLKEQDVRLTLFYKLLWRHVIAVELLQRHYKLYSAEEQKVGLASLSGIFRKKDKRKEEALEYLQQWGNSFWQGTQERVRELVTEFEHQIDAGFEGGISGLQTSLAGERRTLERETKEIVDRAQKVVESIQIEKLDQVLTILDDDAFADPARPYYVIIDDLDKEWADEEFAYDLIDALIAEVQEFAKRPNVKLIVALRENIVEQLHRRSGGPRGRQREKQDALMLRLRWLPDDLVALLNRRLEVLVKKQYGGTITVDDILPGGSRNRISGIDYLLQRTFMRPRDAIQFMNFCFEEAVGERQITWEAIYAAERRYSIERARSLVDEWRENYPGIETLVRSISGLEDGFTLTRFPDEALVAISAEGEQINDPRNETTIVMAMAAQGVDPREFILMRLYRIAALGVKLPGPERIAYSYVDPDALDNGVPPGAEFYFHPALYQALNVIDPRLTRAVDAKKGVELPGPVAARRVNG